MVRRQAVALVTAVAFTLASSATALASTPLALAGEAGPPAPVSLVLVDREAPAPAPTSAPGAQAAVAAPTSVPADVPVRVPAPQKATLGKLVLFLLALVGLVVLLAIGIVLFGLYDLTHDNV